MSDDAELTFCSYACTHKELAVQAVFICRDCQDGPETKCCCEACASRCHAGHDVVAIGYGRCYCDCGASPNCKLAKVSVEAASRLLPGPRKCGLGAQPPEGLDMTTRTFLIEGVAQAQLEALREECCCIAQVSKDTFWLPCNAGTSVGRSLRNSMEQFAALVFRHHTAGLAPDSFDRQVSGAEFWTQVKPLGSDGGVDLHYDKDEELAESFGLGIFPQISTVTYLHSFGSSGEDSLIPCPAPTILFSNKITDKVGEKIMSAVISHPAPSKHLSFDGRLLHGAPAHPGLRRGAFCDTGGQSGTTLQRVTFLVNIWLNHRPAAVSELTPDLVERIRQGPPSAAELPSSARFVPSPASATAVVEEFGKRITLPFLSSSATWGKDVTESGLSLSMCLPTLRSNASSSSSIPSTILLNFPSRKAALLVQEDDAHHPVKRHARVGKAQKKPASSRSAAAKSMRRPAAVQKRPSMKQKSEGRRR